MAIAHLAPSAKYSIWGRHSPTTNKKVISKVLHCTVSYRYPTTFHYAGTYRRRRTSHSDRDCEQRSKPSKPEPHSRSAPQSCKAYPFLGPGSRRARSRVAAAAAAASRSYPCEEEPRLEEPFSASTDEGAGKTASTDVWLGFPPPVADDDDNGYANVDSMMDAQPNAVATRATDSWTTDEDAQLTGAVANTSKKKRGKEHKTDWVKISASVPGRTRGRCIRRWQGASIDRANGRTGKWTKDEDRKLKDAVQAHGDKDRKDWLVIATLVPGRTMKQCRGRWKDALNPSIALTARRTGKWAEDEGSKLQDAVQTHGSKNWGAIAALVPGRTKRQCWKRWYDALNPNITLTAGRMGKWTPDEDDKLKDSVQRHGGKNWDKITALVPGRTKEQCKNRWQNTLDPSIDRTPPVCPDKWTEYEDSKLKDAVQTHGDKDWVAVAGLVPGRTRKQCCCRWKKYIDPNCSTLWVKEHGTLKKMPGSG